MKRRNFILQGAMASVAACTLSSVGASAMTLIPSKNKPVYFHYLLFWLKDELTTEEKKNFANFFEGLKKLPYVKNLRYGGPANSAPRSVLDNSFSYNAIMEFDSQEELDAYGKLPGHIALIQHYSQFWSKMAVHDSIVK